MFIKTYTLVLISLYYAYSKDNQCTYYLNHILMFHILKQKELFYICKENEKLVVFDIIFVVINIYNETEKRQCCLI